MSKHELNLYYKSNSNMEFVLEQIQLYFCDVFVSTLTSKVNLAAVANTA